jgi:WS/DGAT/MGAT family acyltransferase
MQQLTTMDNIFLQQEGNRTPMHISPIIIYDQSDLARGTVRFKEILTVFERNLPKSAIFRRKLAGGAMGFDTPYWVEDPEFDLEFHVRHVALPKPGDWRQFNILLARLHARGLDMNRPLWEANVIEGLDGIEGLPPNSFAIMLKIHHAAIDGISGAEILTAIHSPTAEGEPSVITDNWQGESNPSILKVASRAYINNLKTPLRFVKTASALVSAVRSTPVKDDEEDRVKPPAIRTRFNHGISAFRVTDTVKLDLAEVKRIKNSVEGATVNDVIVSVVGGALNKYLEAKNETPKGSLKCGAPINARSERSSESTGNQVSMMIIDMATNIPDPVERLKAVHGSATEAKEGAAHIGNDLMMDISRSLTPQVWGIGMGAILTTAMRTNMALPMHTIISNVPGPQSPMYLAGAKVHTLLGMGPLLDMSGLFHAIISGVGGICINFVSCREMMPDPEFYRSCLQEAYDELRDATLKPKKKRKVRKK